MRTILLKLIPAMLVAFGVPLFVQAAPNDLVVQFQNTPLFAGTQLIPGRSDTRYARVRNNLATPENVATEAIFVSDPSSLGVVINLKIQESSTGTTPLVDKPLADFFAQGETFLSSVGANTTTTYYYTITMLATTSDAYASTSLGFDLIIGYQGTLTPPPTGPGGGVSGGGGGSPPPGLSINNERIGITNILATSALISWDTSYKATSRVVYGTSTGVFTYSTDTMSFYGYQSSTAEFDTPASVNGVLHHTVQITQLKPATTYYFRTISHASPDTVSRELSFTTLSLEELSDLAVDANKESSARVLLAVAPRRSDAGLNPPGPRIASGEGYVAPEDAEALLDAPKEDAPPVASLEPVEVITELPVTPRRGLLAAMLYAVGNAPFYVHFILFVSLLSLVVAGILQFRAARERTW